MKSYEVLRILNENEIAQNAYRFIMMYRLHVFGKLVWQAADGRKIRFECIDDDHLKNIVKHVRPLKKQYGEKFFACLLAYSIYARKLSLVNDLSGSPEPFKRDGKMMMYSHETQSYQTV